MNLGPPSNAPGNRRPFQHGRARGHKSGIPVTIDVEWLIDSGADLGCIRQGVASQFTLTPTAVTAAPTAGGAMLVCSGLSVELTVESYPGIQRKVWVTTDVAVKPDTGRNIVGVDQVHAAEATISWDPATQSGALREHAVVDSAWKTFIIDHLVRRGL